MGVYLMEIIKISFGAGYEHIKYIVSDNVKYVNSDYHHFGENTILIDF
jgi:hypothetical protein